MKRLNKYLVLLLCTNSLFAQTDTSKNLTFSAYGEFYYSYDFAEPQNHEKPSFIYNHKRHNELNTNLILVKASYSKNNVRANFGLMAGNYAQYNLSNEPTWGQFIYEANIGIQLSKKATFWLDVGIMPSHIGFESAISSECWTLTRSVLAENSPYYETGIKLSYQNKKKKFNASFLVLNGWQKIKRPDNFQNPSFGLQLNYKPTERLTLNYSNFIGSDKPDSLNAWRTYHNFYGLYERKKIGIIMGFDIGTDKFNSREYGICFSPIFIFRYTINKHFKVALREEYYKDKKQIFITTNQNSFALFGISTNLDYQITKTVLFRLEGKLYQAENEIFKTNSKENFSFTSNLTIKL